MFETMYAGLEFCHVGIGHDRGINDFTTFSVTLPSRAFAPLVVQFASDSELADFTAPGATPDVSRTIVHACVKRAVDAPAFLTLPASKAEISVFSPIILAVDDAVVGVALAMSNAMPISCVPDFPLLHPTLMPREQAFVVKVAIMCALEAPITWRESMRMPRQLDTVFGVDDRAREMLADATGDAMQFYYPEMEDTQSARRAGEVTY